MKLFGMLLRLGPETTDDATMHTMIAAVTFVFVTLSASLAGASKIKISGRILDEQGSPIPKAEVVLLPFVDPVTDARRMQQGECMPVSVELTASDHSGTFQMKVPHAGLWRVQISKPSHVPQEAYLSPLLEDTELQEAVLVRDAELQIRVVGAAGVPVVGALVRVFDKTASAFSQQTIWHAPSRCGFVDAEGDLTLPVAEGERRQISVSAAGFIPQETLETADSRLHVVLAEGAPQTLVVLNAHGNPAAGVLITCGKLQSFLATTDEAGAATIRLSSGGKIELELTAEDGRTLKTRISPAKNSLLSISHIP